MFEHLVSTIVQLHHGVPFELFWRENLYIMPHVQYLKFDYENYIINTMGCPLSNAIGLTKFGYSLKKIRLFYPEHMFETSNKTIQKPIFHRVHTFESITTQKLKFTPHIP
jgi:hypothetical protein